jgi:hypothetical protein
MQSQPQSLSPDVQAIIDLCEIHGMPLWYEDDMFCTHKIRIGADKTVIDYSKTAKTWRVEQVLHWLNTFKDWSPVYDDKP